MMYMKTKALPPLGSGRTIQGSSSGLLPRFLIALYKLGPGVKGSRSTDGGKGRVWNPSDLGFRLSTTTNGCATLD